MNEKYLMPALENNNSLNLSDGFLMGNIQKNTYIPYKNMTYIKPSFSFDRQKELFEIQRLSFIALDINLYLDTHPNDYNMIKLYNKYLNEEKRLTNIYERKYGPINLYDDVGLDENPWAWIKNPWPWNK